MLHAPVHKGAAIEGLQGPPLQTLLQVREYLLAS